MDHCLAGKIWPSSIVSLVFRVFSFALVVTVMRYWAIPLYAVIFFSAICLGRFWNKDKETFVIKGFKSLLFMGKPYMTSRLIVIVLNVL